MLSLNPAMGDELPPTGEPDPNPVEHYEVTRDERGRVRCRIWRGFGVFMPLPHIVRHSPDGFEIGYGGSGPSDLALSILAYHLGTTRVEPRVYNAFKFSFLAHSQWYGGRRLAASEIEAWLGMLRAQSFELEAAS